MGPSVAEFVAWPKISRFGAEKMVITEKIDGTNACVIIEQTEFGSFEMHAQSRNRMITCADDNAGFARWCNDNFHTLVPDLGPGRHYGEWWGQGIQRNYGLDHKRFSLFAAHRFKDAAPYFKTPNLRVVPVLHTGPLDTRIIEEVEGDLHHGGSEAAPGWAKPEGVVVYLVNGGASYKITDAVQGPSKPRLATE